MGGRKGSARAGLLCVGSLCEEFEGGMIGTAELNEEAGRSGCVSRGEGEGDWTEGKGVEGEEGSMKGGVSRGEGEGDWTEGKESLCE